MQEKYFINGGKTGYSWNQLLYWVYKNIVGDGNRYWDKKDRCYRYEYYSTANSWARVEDFFTRFKHNPNDGGYWTEGHYEKVFVGYDYKKREAIYENGAWIQPEWKVKEGGTYVTDNFGRIIPSGFIRTEYLKYVPNKEHDVKTNYYGRWRFYRSQHIRFDFRKDPVPFTGGRHNWCGRRYRGNHGSFGNEARQNEVFKTELKDIKEEFGVEVKYNRGRVKDVWSLYTDWDGYHWSGKGHGWKRTRKKRQWM